ncbi:MULTISPECIES: flagellar hook assembly protein FlgD [Bacillaceae]|uniref:flagellar hook assembly protein FlgD n=1 Tax=Bacillaceae TaxID=186817 RepID=UPI001CEF7168|nr:MULTISPECIES: flagellar hook assembly protein FlgD [Bacillaceae]
MTTIDTSLLYSSLQNQTREVKNNLDKDDFLKLLLTQLQNQDPTSPMDDTDFIAQMATFSSLEQMTNMNTTLESFVNSQNQNLLITYSQFVGQEVTYHKLANPDNEGGDTEVVEGKGVVKSIQFVDESVKFILEDGTVLEPANISSINQLSEGNNLAEASRLIGKQVTWLDDKGEEHTAEVSSVFQRDGKVKLEVNDEAKTSLLLNQLIKVG